MAIEDQGRTFNAQQLALAKELRMTVCRCGNQKRHGNSFCVSCYMRLPVELKKRLYQRIGKGYEEAYFEAEEFLRLPKRKPAAAAGS